jgi:hypothetical protein
MNLQSELVKALETATKEQQRRWMHKQMGRVNLMMMQAHRIASDRVHVHQIVQITTR